MTLYSSVITIPVYNDTTYHSFHYVVNDLDCIWWVFFASVNRYHFIYLFMIYCSDINIIHVR